MMQKLLRKRQKKSKNIREAAEKRLFCFLKKEKSDYYFRSISKEYRKKEKCVTETAGEYRYE